MPEPSRVPEGFSEEAVLNPQRGEELRAAVRRWRRQFASSLGPWCGHLPSTLRSVPLALGSPPAPPPQALFPPGKMGRGFKSAQPCSAFAARLRGFRKVISLFCAHLAHLWSGWAAVVKVVRPNGKSAGSRLAAGHTAFCTDSKAGRLPPTRSTHRSTHRFPFLRLCRAGHVVPAGS